MALPPVGRRTRPTPRAWQVARSTCRSSGWPYPSETVGGAHAKKRRVGGDVPAWRPRQSASSIAMLVAPSAGSVTSSRHARGVIGSLLRARVTITRGIASVGRRGRGHDGTAADREEREADGDPHELAEAPHQPEGDAV